MKTAIMQPYFFPYLGYFQLINAVDTFVFLDDVNFIKKGYINRNSILLNNKAHLLTLPVSKISQNKRINEHTISNNIEALLKTIEHAYRKAPFYKEVAPLLIKMFTFDETNLSRYLGYQLTSICEYLDIKCRFLYASELNVETTIKGQERILSLCKMLQTTRYINANGGKHLYNEQAFEQVGIKLNFIQPSLQTYQQYDNDFVNFLSIIDVMMFNSKEQISTLLTQYILE